MKPGYNTKEELWEKVPDKFCYDTAEFMRPTREKIDDPIWADIGERNKKALIISKTFEIGFYSIIADDFNFDPFPSNDKYDLITCFEVLEHLTNPAFLLRNIVNLMHNDTILFISTPGRPKWMWSAIHYHEIDRKRIEKWLFNEAGLEIVREGRINMYYPRWKMWLGIRPMIRRYLCYTNIYELRLKNSV